MNSVSSCPICYISLPPLELERHANRHFEDEDLQHAKDFEQQKEVGDGSVSCLRSSQIRGPFYHVDACGGLMGLLCNCLESDSDNRTTVLLSGYVDHFQSVEDTGWGCGWRNIQMLSSYLLSCRKDASKVFFGGCGFVPDIPFLQRWLEIAWESGFDAPGAHHFGNSIYGSKLWIGTTECAALFRSFGLRARVIDFGPEEMESLFLSLPGTCLDSESGAANSNGKRNAFRVCGPLDKYLSGKKHQVHQTESAVHDKSQCSTDKPGLAGRNNHRGSISKNSHQILLDYVWNYFSDESLSTSVHHPHVFMTNKSPLYFQHDGHSRTIVGIEVKNQGNGTSQYNLLILDPGHETSMLERSLKENVGWKRLIKRGVHTLKKPQYQLCYIEPGIASGMELDKLKTIDSVFIKF